MRASIHPCARLRTLRYSLVYTALFIYDSFIIFDREVASFWAAKRWTGASLLFLANKWISLMVYITAMILFAPFPSDEVSRHYQLMPCSFATLRLTRLQRWAYRLAGSLFQRVVTNPLFAAVLRF